SCAVRRDRCRIATRTGCRFPTGSFDAGWKPAPPSSGVIAVKTSRTAKLPLFYTHGIGSLPRPQLVRDLLAQRGQVAPDRFQHMLDDCVVFAIRLQEQAGLDVVSDGEWRRSQYIREFLDRVGGFERCR